MIIQQFICCNPQDLRKCFQFNIRYESFPALENFPGVIIAGLLAILLQYLDSSFILTIHIILFIMGLF